MKKNAVLFGGLQLGLLLTPLLSLWNTAAGFVLPALLLLLSCLWTFKGSKEENASPVSDAEFVSQFFALFLLFAGWGHCLPRLPGILSALGLGTAGTVIFIVLSILVYAGGSFAGRWLCKNLRLYPTWYLLGGAAFAACLFLCFAGGLGALGGLLLLAFLAAAAVSAMDQSRLLPATCLGTLLPGLLPDTAGFALSAIAAVGAMALMLYVCRQRAVKKQRT